MACTERARHRAAAPHFVRLFWRHGELDRAALNEAGGLSRLVLEPAIKILRVFGQHGLRLGIAQRGEQAGRVPGGAASELLALQQHDVGPAELGEVIGNGTANDAAANDDDAGVGRKRFAHRNLSHGTAFTLAKGF